MLHFLDHNVVAPALAHLGAVESTSDIVNASPEGNVAIASLQYTVRAAIAGRIELVLSETCADTLYRVLIRGGGDFAAMSPEDAYAAVSVLVALAETSGTYVTAGTIATFTRKAKALCADTYGTGPGRIDDEDLWVIANLLAVKSDDEYAVLVTEDGGLHESATALAGKRIAVIRANAWLFTQTDKRRVA